jgi:hypothetical protein
MASTDTRSGFRLPWSSDRSHDDTPQEPQVDAAADPAAAESEVTDPMSSEPAAGDMAWPATDLHARPGIKDEAPQPSESVSPDGPSAEEPPMVDQQSAPPSSAPPSKKPSKLMADLSAAIRSTAETARDQSLAQTDADARQVVTTIREQSTEGAAGLRQQCDEDIAGIREWSKAEIARIREETDDRISSRKSTLEQELADHAASVDYMVEEVEAEVARYQAEMESYLERLRNEDDPARLATLAESMPDAPSFEAWVARDEVVEPEAALADVEPEEAATEVDTALAGGTAATIDGEAEGIAAGPAEAEGVAPGTAAAEDVPAVVGDLVVDADADARPIEDRAPEADEVEHVVEAEGTVEPGGAVEAGDMVEARDMVEAGDMVETGEDAPSGTAEDTPDDSVVEEELSAEPQPAGAHPWGDMAGDWTTPPESRADDNAPRWAAGETPEGFPEPDTRGDPVDRGAIMAALEAAAEAVVAAESAADSADQAEVAAGVAETAAELVRRLEREAEAGNEDARAALEARVGAGGFETESFTDRLASLLPGHGANGGDGEPQMSQVVVAGLISVASIASFKRHLGRVPGVSNVAVASGPDGEFVFNVTHQPDVAFRDVIPTMPGFAARVTNVADNLVHVTARDPESES